MTVFTVTKEGEVTLTQDVLKRLGMRPGDQVAVVERADGTLELSALKTTGKDVVKAKKTGGLEAFFGSLKNKHNVHLTIEEINEEIAKAWAGENDHR
ncbi:hypothetical protein EDE05_103127 [Neorhizobium sp. R1-B]|jgi:bifunctional DNA-binding transcriptional regulator/antitoxin component of YhaV-PrlF toxin-antitoxin module|uniref:AbrB/MazE/SpoVT family DNA-binding domain-containing protein n=1 Tax=unclassified Neorhizobium TaxID=2629175 RepID=UPI000DD7218F|nr:MULTISPECIES: AbrB/MazE/SpoVT family DNA-binding domain-containing protein [unclassified Neorhizobium]TCV74372.1 hypothetical protein EDE09_102127 [Neorhizobium sp. S3-V5DH]TDX87558.1 hypothetical protein EDE05_103127 [Neorhizobium sp. R1-B]